MNRFTNYNYGSTAKQVNDEGLRKYMISIFNYMALALVITGAVAYFASQSEVFIKALYNISEDGSAAGLSGFGWIITFAPLILAVTLMSRIYSMSFQTAQTLFFSYAVLIGLSLTSVFLIYTGESIARVFFISASTFGAAAIYGQTTKKDLSSFGSFLIMGVFGIVFVSLANIFFKSNAITFATSLIGTFIFIGLTAYDMQNLKNMYYHNVSNNVDEDKKLSLLGALNLYLNFINIFISMLRLFGERK
jgi:FtsH-binding integral membrane protein